MSTVHAVDVGGALAAIGRPRRFRARDVVFHEGDPADAVHVVRAGVVKVSSYSAGREVVLDLLGPGDLLGELSVIDGGVRSATATALVATETVAVAAADFHDHLAHHGELAVALLRATVVRLRHTSRRQVEYGALDAVGRVCRRLAELVERDGGLDEVTPIAAPVSQGDIAAWAGLSREAVVKAMHTLRRAGWVRTQSRSITVVDLAAVRARANLPRR